MNHAAEWARSQTSKKNMCNPPIGPGAFSTTQSTIYAPASTVIGVGVKDWDKQGQQRPENIPQKECQRTKKVR